MEKEPNKSGLIFKIVKKRKKERIPKKRNISRPKKSVILFKTELITEEKVVISSNSNESSPVKKNEDNKGTINCEKSDYKILKKNENTQREIPEIFINVEKNDINKDVSAGDGAKRNEGVSSNYDVNKKGDSSETGNVNKNEDADEIVKEEQNEISEIFTHEKNKNNVSTSYKIKEYEDEKEIINYNEKFADADIDIEKDEYNQNEIFEICTNKKKENSNEDGSDGDVVKKKEDDMKIKNQEKSYDESVKKNLHNQNEISDICINEEKKNSNNNISAGDGGMNISAGDGGMKMNNYPLFAYNINNFKKESKFKLYNKK